MYDGKQQTSPLESLILNSFWWYPSSIPHKHCNLGSSKNLVLLLAAGPGEGSRAIIYLNIHSPVKSEYSSLLTRYCELSRFSENVYRFKFQKRTKNKQAVIKPLKSVFNFMHYYVLDSTCCHLGKNTSSLIT